MWYSPVIHVIVPLYTHSDDPATGGTHTWLTCCDDGTDTGHADTGQTDRGDIQTGETEVPVDIGHEVFVRVAVRRD